MALHCLRAQTWADEGICRVVFVTSAGSFLDTVAGEQTRSPHCYRHRVTSHHCALNPCVIHTVWVPLAVADRGFTRAEFVHIRGMTKEEAVDFLCARSHCTLPRRGFRLPVAPWRSRPKRLRLTVGDLPRHRRKQRGLWRDDRAAVLDKLADLAGDRFGSLVTCARKAASLGADEVAGARGDACAEQPPPSAVTRVALVALRCLGRCRVVEEGSL